MNAVKIGGQVLYVFGGGVFTLLVGLPLQIYVVRSLGAQPFGAYSVVEGALATIANLLAFGIHRPPFASFRSILLAAKTDMFGALWPLPRSRSLQSASSEP